MMGSCFADEVGGRLVQDKFDCLVNPFGVLYNPASIAQALQLLLEGKPFEEGDLWQQQGLWHSWLHHGSFSAASCEACLTGIQQAFERAVAQVAQLDVLFITLGTNRYYTHRASGVLVANCHKVPQREFEVADCDVEQTVRLLSHAFEWLLQRRPALQIVLTVSPMRYLNYGLHESQLSKATLLLAADRLQRAFPGHIHYFPAYEILLDELRDYRFYDTDMVHPSRLAVDYIYQQFKDHWVAPESLHFCREWQKVQAALQHRPLHEESAEYVRFLQQTLSKLEQLQVDYPQVDLQQEIELCTIRYNKYRH